MIRAGSWMGSIHEMMRNRSSGSMWQNENAGTDQAWWQAYTSCGVFPMADPEGIYNWHRLDSRITTSGQPTEAQLAEIRDLGVRYIVNLGLHTHEKALPDEAATVDRLGMTYIHIPVDFQNPTEQDFEQFCTVMERLKDAPVHVHCIANARVSAFFYRLRRDVLGMDEARARAEMEAVWQPKGVWVEFVKRRGEGT
jgi:uncharacterized protein (TIGR01244 family)